MSATAIRALDEGLAAAASPVDVAQVGHALADLEQTPADATRIWAPFGTFKETAA